MAAYAMRQGGLAAMRAGDRIDRAQRVVRAAHVALGSGRTALGCLHNVYFPIIESAEFSGAIELERPQHGQPRVEHVFAAAAIALVSVGPAAWAQPPAIVAA